MHDYRDLAASLVQKAISRGADEADVFIEQRRSLSVEVRFGRMERLEEAGADRLGLRIFRRGAVVLSYSSDLSMAALHRLVDEALALVAVIDPHPANRLPPASLMGVYEGPLDVYDAGLEALSLEEKVSRVREAEELGMQQDRRITNVHDAWWKDTTQRTTLANSHGFCQHYDATHAAYNLTLVAEDNGVKQQDAWTTQSHSVEGLASPQWVGQEAARRTLRKLGGRPVRTQTVPVVFDPLMAADFVRQIFGTLTGYSVYRRNSFLADLLGKEVGSPWITLIDDATLQGGLGSRPFDAEGVASRRHMVIEAGQLERFLTDGYSSYRLHTDCTGSAVRAYNSSPTVGTSNFFLQPGTASPESLVTSVKRGLYLTKQYWVGINPASGDYSRGAEGIWIEDGELTHAVQEVTIASNMLDMMRNIEVVANDLTFHSPVGAPTFLVSRMMVSGS